MFRIYLNIQATIKVFLLSWVTHFYQICLDSIIKRAYLCSNMHFWLLNHFPVGLNQHSLKHVRFLTVPSWSIEFVIAGRALVKITLVWITTVALGQQCDVHCSNYCWIRAINPFPSGPPIKLTGSSQIPWALFLVIRFCRCLTIQSLNGDISWDTPAWTKTAIFVFTDQILNKLLYLHSNLIDSSEMLLNTKIVLVCKIILK